ncbi:MAG: RNA 2',3'-cyclic phosphodiesterase [Gemmatimonadetes bacterium]|nr:RNA 2',3'-cyclic phosphodiesterase [Gemmatimonadota bacterium]
MRCFIAINPPVSVRDALAAATAPLRGAAPGVPWIEPARLHATVRFLGEVDRSFIDRLRSALGATGRQTRPIPLEIAGLGAFPTWKRARVIWAGVGYEPRLELLHHDIELACTGLGLDVEGRPFRPHLTLARLREPGGDAARAIFRASRGIRFHYAMTLDSIDLMQSIPAGGAPRYERLAAIPLARSR